MSTYSYFLHLRRPSFRLVLKSGSSFPSGLDPIDWKFKEERPYDKVHAEVMKDIECQGFGAYQQDIRSEDIPGARIAASSRR
ncbi:hypothetical protein [Mesorhizobium waimense]|nr:hypothetical protein [Mesorhizobium waimense]